jgi:hypothetical protein
LVENASIGIFREVISSFQKFRRIRKDETCVNTTSIVTGKVCLKFFKNMKRLFLLTAFIFFIVSVYGQGTQVGDSSSPIYHYNGNVGVGVTNPTGRLHNVPASDYVFEPDYDLLSLQEVESFIQQKKHLPDIPSAEEFKENGVGLGEMDDMLLRKIEELTLYVIELKKENENQAIEIQELKTKLN